MGQLREEGAAHLLAVLELAQQGGGGDQHAIGFHPGAIDRLEATGRDSPLQAVEQGRAMPLQPGVERWGGVGEVELGVALHQIEDRGEGALGGLPGIGHGPEPGQIEVGVTQHLHPGLVDGSRGTVASQRALSRQLPQGRAGVAQ